MLAAWRRWRRRRVLRGGLLDAGIWEPVCRRQPLLAELPPPERARLRELTTLFLAEKDFLGAAGFEPQPQQAATVAALACLPVLELGFDWYDDWHSVILYPSGFVARHRYQDEHGLEHEWAGELSGEAWDAGPVVLSWPDVQRGTSLDGYNVVLHEMAHKLDMCNGDPNGFPPLPAGMSRQAWSRAFQDAYRQLEAREAAGQDDLLDPYALENPGEFFAVAAEAFFELPAALRSDYPEVYSQLREFFRQDPGARRATSDPT